MNLVAFASIPANMAGANPTPSVERSTVFSTSSWGDAIAGAILVLVVVAALAIILKRRIPPTMEASKRPLQTDVPQDQEDSVALEKARLEELAATSGILAGLLDEYLRSRFYHLLIIFPDAQTLQKRLSEVEGEYAAVSFFYFCKLIFLLAERESQGWAVPLLSSQVARSAAQHLLNGFLASLPQGEMEVSELSIETFEIARKFQEWIVKAEAARTRSGAPIIQVDAFVREVNPERYCKGQDVSIKEKLLADDFAAYEKWLLLAPPGLIVAADTLQAICSLLSQDLHGAGAPFRPGLSSMQAETELSAVRVLADSLTPVGLEEVLSGSQLPRPIGLYLRKSRRDLARQAPQIAGEEFEKAKAQIKPTLQSPRSYTLEELKELGVLGPRIDARQFYGGVP